MQTAIKQAREKSPKKDKGKDKKAAKPASKGKGKARADAPAPTAGPSRSSYSPGFVSRDQSITPLPNYVAEELFFVVVDGSNVDMFELCETSMITE